MIEVKRGKDTYDNIYNIIEKGLKELFDVKEIKKVVWFKAEHPLVMCKVYFKVDEKTYFIPFLLTEYHLFLEKWFAGFKGTITPVKVGKHITK